jgi:hypothetical protein
MWKLRCLIAATISFIERSGYYGHRPSRSKRLTGFRNHVIASFSMGLSRLLLN